MKITSNVYVETEFRGATTSYVTTEDGVVVIDTPYRPTDAVKWRAEIQSKGVVKYVMNTESHPDHTTGDFFFQVPVIAQEICREEILKINPENTLKSVADIDPEGIPLVKNFKYNIPSISFSKRLTLYLGKHSFQLIHMPGHSAGQTAIYVPEEKVVFTGDNVFGKVQSFLQSADPFAWLKSLKQLDKLDIDYVVPGHGEVVGKSSIADQMSYIQECLDCIMKAVEKGLSREETLAKVTLPHRYPLEGGLEKHGPVLVQLSVAHLYDLLSEK